MAHGQAHKITNFFVADCATTHHSIIRQAITEKC